MRQSPKAERALAESMLKSKNKEDVKRAKEWFKEHKVTCKTYQES